MKNAIIHWKSKEYKNWTFRNIFRKLSNCQYMNCFKPQKTQIMKLKITSTAIALMVTLSLSGQKHEYSFGKHSKKAKTEHRRESDALRFQNQPYHPQNPAVKSALVEKSSLDQRDYFLWDEGTGDWYIYNHEDYAYGTNGMINQYVYAEWDDDLDALLLDWKAEYSYNANGKYSLVMEYVWDDILKQWNTDRKTEYTYDASENPTLIISYVWDGQWIEQRKQEFIYEDGKQVEYLRHEWNESISKWGEEDKEEMTYDTNGNRILLIDYDWNESTTSWDSAFMVVDSYDVNNYLTESIEYVWNDVNEEWTNAWKYEYNNDSHGIVAMETEYIWLDYIESWDENRTIDYVNDSNGNPIVEQIATYYNGTGGLLYYTKYTYTYDDSFVLADLLLPPLSWFVPDYSEQIVNKPLDFLNEDFDRELLQWYKYAKAIYHYDVDEASSIVEVEREAPIEVYPNPVSDFLSFRISAYRGELSFKLYDMTGRRVMSTKVGMGETVNMEQISRGVYLYQIAVEGKIKRGKLIKK